MSKEHRNLHFFKNARTSASCRLVLSPLNALGKSSYAKEIVIIWITKGITNCIAFQYHFDVMGIMLEKIDEQKNSHCKKNLIKS